MRVHTYVIATDAGSAPNYDPPAVTLAVCKPRIRKKAKVGELVLAFAGAKVNPTSRHSVVWTGIVSEILTFSEYDSHESFGTLQEVMHEWLLTTQSGLSSMVRKSLLHQPADLRHLPLI
ncbi:hypothetical protein ACIPZG_09820 [Pseudomonas sp. NPDC089395]|uniref:Nmad2 family putative nucleotide modification protein n=1 Tax=Pseudomonas sp. NPDC089395 TaxID=3364460 RepID=UPI003818292D